MSVVRTGNHQGMDGVVLTLRTADGREVVRGRRLVPRAPGQGRLASPLDGDDGDHVRCACEECGAHLLGTTDARGHTTGICLVCGGVAVRAL